MDRIRQTCCSRRTTLPSLTLKLNQGDGMQSISDALLFQQDHCPLPAGIRCEIHSIRPSPEMTSVVFLSSLLPAILQVHAMVVHFKRRACLLGYIGFKI